MGQLFHLSLYTGKREIKEKILWKLMNEVKRNILTLNIIGIALVWFIFWDTEYPRYKEPIDITIKCDSEPVFLDYLVDFDVELYCEN